MAEEKSLGEQYNDSVEALKASGMSNADAIRETAKKFGKTENAVRGSLHQLKTKNGTAGTTRRRNRSAPASIDDLLAGARQSLEQALSLVDSEVEDAKAALDAAQQRYDEVVAGVKDRKADIEKKLKAMA